MRQSRRILMLGVVLTGLLLLFSASSWSATQLGLDGTDDYAREALGTTSPSALDVSTFTIEAWIYPTAEMEMAAVSDSAYILGIVRRYDTDYHDYRLGIGLYLWDSSGALNQFKFFYYDNPVLNAWNHVVGMFDGSTNACWIGING